MKNFIQFTLIFLIVGFSTFNVAAQPLDFLPKNQSEEVAIKYFAEKNFFVENVDRSDKLKLLKLTSKIDPNASVWLGVSEDEVFGYIYSTKLKDLSDMLTTFSLVQKKFNDNFGKCEVIKMIPDNISKSGYSIEKYFREDKGQIDIRWTATFSKTEYEVRLYTTSDRSLSVAYYVN